MRGSERGAFSLWTGLVPCRSLQGRTAIIQGTARLSIAAIKSGSSFAFLLGRRLLGGQPRAGATGEPFRVVYQHEEYEHQN